MPSHTTLPQVFTALGCMRFRPYLCPAATAWMALNFALPLANITWRRRCAKSCPEDGGSWGRWREALCALVRAFACTGVTWRMVLRMFAAERGAAGRARMDRNAHPAVAALDYINLSAAPGLIMLAFKPLRIG